MKDKFEELTKQYPNLGSYLVYGRLIKMTPKENWNRRKIVSWFKLVDPSDYLKSERVGLIEHLIYGLKYRGQMQDLA